MKKFCAQFCLFLLLLSFAAVRANGYEVISSDEQLQKLVPKITGMLLSDFGIALRNPVSIKLAEGKKLDEMYGGRYRGAEIGLYRRTAAGHEIFIMKDMNQDEVSGTLAHELVHAWQAEACVPNQTATVKEGFASWVQFKILDSIGAYTLANSVKNQADPIYGVGMRRMLEWEEKLGEKQLVVKIRSVVDVSDEI